MCEKYIREMSKFKTKKNKTKIAKGNIDRYTYFERYGKT